MSLDKSKVAIVTTVCNWDLYERTKHFFPNNIKIFAIDGTRSFYGIKSMVFFMKKLKKYNLEWLIMADEDVIFTNPEKVFDLIEYLHINDYTVSGTSEASRFENWTKHPYVINTFFGILNLKDIYKIYDEKEMLKNQYVLENEFSHKESWMPEYPHKINSLAEPYYCFFLWLLRKEKKTKFLNISRPVKDDLLTTVVHDHNGHAFLSHTWYARFYKIDNFHTFRIDKIIKQGLNNCTTENPIILIDHKHNFKFFLYKYFHRFLRKFQ